MPGQVTCAKMLLRRGARLEVETGRNFGGTALDNARATIEEAASAVPARTHWSSWRCSAPSRSAAPQLLDSASSCAVMLQVLRMCCPPCICSYGDGFISHTSQSGRAPALWPPSEAQPRERLTSRRRTRRRIAIEWPPPSSRSIAACSASSRRAALDGRSRRRHRLDGAQLLRDHILPHLEAAGWRHLVDAALERHTSEGGGAVEVECFTTVGSLRSPRLRLSRCGGLYLRRKFSFCRPRVGGRQHHTQYGSISVRLLPCKLYLRVE